MITETLFDEGEKSVSIVERECLACLRKLPNYKEYENLPEYRRIVKNMEKGVAVHHSGILPVFKEMIEMMFAKGFVKLLFATETFAVGVNMPTKTVIFTGFQKISRVIISTSKKSRIYTNGWSSRTTWVRHGWTRYSP